MSNMGSSSLGISYLTIGINANGMQEYKDSLRVELLANTKDKINDVADVVTAIDGAWQGKSRDLFLRQFEETRAKITEDLDAEYRDLNNRLTDLQSSYFAIDQSLIQE